MNNSDSHYGIKIEEHLITVVKRSVSNILLYSLYFPLKIRVKDELPGHMEFVVTWWGSGTFASALVTTSRSKSGENATFYCKEHDIDLRVT